MTLLRAQLSLEALSNNLKLIRSYAERSPIWGMVKANAYGHSAQLIAPYILERVDGLGCARVEEALDLAGSMATMIKPILILGGGYSLSDWYDIQKNGFVAVVHEQFQLDMLKSLPTTSQSKLPIKVWLKINVGMNRLGFNPEDCLTVLQTLSEIKAVKLVGVMAHLGTADEPLHPETSKQMKLVNDIFAKIKLQLPNIQTSLSNSAHLFASQHQTALNYPWHGQMNDWVRPGISMYGGSPFARVSVQDLGLTPVMTLEAKVVSVRDIKNGERVGYGATWQATEPTRLYALAIGYGDGFPRHIQNATAYFQGVHLQQAGQISMDLTVFYQTIKSLKRGPAPRVGDFVELWGQHIPVDEVAAKSQTIGYERLTQLSTLRVDFTLN